MDLICVRQHSFATRNDRIAAFQHAGGIQRSQRAFRNAELMLCAFQNAADRPLRTLRIGIHNRAARLQNQLFRIQHCAASGQIFEPFAPRELTAFQRSGQS